jgi:hypothetical protein
MKRLILLVVVVLMIGVLAVPAGALSYDKTAGIHGPPGSQLLLGTEDVPAAKVGLLCSVEVDIGNNDSTRPGSDITVASGSSSQLFPDTEKVAGNAPPVTIQLVLGTTITVTLTFGPNKEFDGHGFDNAAFSGSGIVTVGACEAPPSPAPISVSPEIIVAPATAARSTDAASPVLARPAFTG